MLGEAFKYVSSLKVLSYWNLNVFLPLFQGVCPFLKYYHIGI